MKQQEFAFSAYFLSLTLFSILLTSCGPSLADFIPRQQTVIGMDLTKYKEKGFLITPGEYGANYESIGYLYFTIYPEAEKQRTEQGIISWKLGEVDYQEVIDFAYRTAISKGADAITHLKVRSVQKTHTGVGASVTLDGLEVSGLLIKRR